MNQHNRDEPGPMPPIAPTCGAGKRFSFFIDLVGVTLVSKVTEASGVQLYNTRSVCRTVAHRPVTSPAVTDV